MAGEQRLHPAEITVIVSSAGGLPASKSGKCRASVIFGVGKTKFRTQVLDTTNPVWNERSTVPVTEGDASALVFQVTRKDRPLGEVCIPLDRIPLKCSAPNIVALAPCRDCSSPVGTLTYECWVSKHYGSHLAASADTPRSKSMRMRVGSSFRGNFRRGSDERNAKQADGEQGGRSSPRQFGGSSSPVRSPAATAPHGGGHVGGNQEESSLRPDTATPDASNRRSSSMRGRNIEDAMRRRFSFAKSEDTRQSSSHPNLSTLTKEPAPPTPKVTGISPRDGTMAGGTAITLRGENLGTDVEDIKAVTVCGVACQLIDLEYISASKLVCLTPAGKTGTGPVEVQTVSQGKGSSTVTFTYWDPAQEPEDRVPVLVEAEAVASINNSITDGTAIAAMMSAKKKRFGQSTSKTSVRDSNPQVDERKDAAIDDLTKRVSQLEFENSRLNIYIEKLVAKVMERNPEILAS